MKKILIILISLLFLVSCSYKIYNFHSKERVLLSKHVCLEEERVEFTYDDGSYYECELTYYTNKDTDELIQYETSINNEIIIIYYDNDFIIYSIILDVDLNGVTVEREYFIYTKNK